MASPAVVIQSSPNELDETKEIPKFMSRKPMFTSPFKIIAAGAEVEKIVPETIDSINPTLVRLLGEHPALVREIPSLCNAGNIVVAWTKEHGTMSGLLFGARGPPAKMLFTLIVHIPSLLQSTVVHVPFEALAGLKVFETPTKMSDAAGNAIDVGFEVKPVNAARFELNGQIKEKDPDQNCFYVKSLDINRAYRIITVDKSEISLLANTDKCERQLDRKFVLRAKQLGTSILSFMEKPSSEAKAVQTVQSELEALLEIRVQCSAAVQMTILIPYIKTVLQTAYALDDSFKHWVLGLECWDDALLQDFLKVKANQAEWDAQFQTEPPPVEPRENVPGPSAPAANQNTASSAIDEEGYHRGLRAMGIRAKPRKIKFVHTLPLDPNRKNGPVVVQMNEMFRRFPKEHQTMRKYGDGETDFEAGNIVEVTDPLTNMHSVITCMAKCQIPPCNDMFASMQSFSDEYASFAPLGSIKKFECPDIRRVFRSASGAWIGPGDRCKITVLFQEQISVFVSAILDDKCIYAFTPTKSKVLYVCCNCSDLIFIEDGPPEKFDIRLVAYDRAVNKYTIPKVREDIERANQDVEMN